MSITTTTEIVPHANYQLFGKLKPCLSDKINAYICITGLVCLPIGTAFLGLGIKKTNASLIASGTLIFVLLIGSVVFLMRKIFFCSTSEPIAFSDPFVDKDYQNSKSTPLLPPPEDAHFF